SQDGRLMAVCNDGKARVWNAKQLDAPPAVFASGESSPLLSGAFSPRGDAIMAGSASGFAYVWKLDAADRSKPWAVLRGHADAARTEPRPPLHAIPARVRGRPGTSPSAVATRGWRGRRARR